MAEEDDASKTEDPTDKKLFDARSKGNAAKSTEVNSWFMLVGALFSLIFIAPFLAESTRNVLKTFILQANSFPTDFKHLQLLLFDVI